MGRSKRRIPLVCSLSGGHRYRSFHDSWYDHADADGARRTARRRQWDPVISTKCWILIGTAVALTLAISQVPAGEIASAFNGSLGEAAQERFERFMPGPRYPLLCWQASRCWHARFVGESA